jgi:NAD(P)-dependent dehydrogenase (short-subunit alcohol dehydrogenase family)
MPPAGPADTALGPSRVSVITGAAGGIGRAVAQALLERGDRVIAFDVEPSTLAPADRLTIIRGDATNPADVQRLAEAVSSLGGLHVLVNAIGAVCTGRFETLTLEDWRVGFENNIVSAVHVIRALLPMLRATRGDRVIVNLSSTLARVADPDTIAYGSFKAALEHFTRTLALDLAPHHIRVVAVAPGPVSGTAADEQWAEDRFARLNPLGRFATPAEVAGVIAFLSSAAAQFITGSIYAIDGGDSALGVGWGSTPGLRP